MFRDLTIAKSSVMASLSSFTAWLSPLRSGEGGQKGDRRDDRCELHDGTHRFASLSTECRLERRQRGFIVDGSHARSMNFDQGRVPG